MTEKEAWAAYDAQKETLRLMLLGVTKCSDVGMATIKAVVSAVHVLDVCEEDLRRARDERESEGDN